jgi:hypothetical protein
MVGIARPSPQPLVRRSSSPEDNLKPRPEGEVAATPPESPPPPRTHVSVTEVADLLDQLHAAKCTYDRGLWQALEDQLIDWLNHSPDLDAAYHGFRTQGGRSGSEFRRFIEDSK